MMQIILPRSWRDEFAFAAKLTREDILHRERSAQSAAHQRQTTIKKQIDQKRREHEFAMLEAAFVPPARIADCLVKFDRYDTKTVEALMDNQQARDFVREKINRLLGEAHTLPDGRRVFKAEDGQQVFDEHGQELSRDLIDPAIIGDHKSRWEPFRDAKLEDARLMRERQELHEYQAKLDQARERLDEGDITEGELKKLEADMLASMPDAVREKLGLEKPNPSSAPEPNARQAEPLNNMGDLMRQTGLGPSVPTPG